MNAAELHVAMVDAKKALDDALIEHRDCVLRAANTDKAARIAKAKAYLSASGTVQERQARVDLATADEQYMAKLADGMERSALEAIRAYRQQLSAWQSLAAATREEAHLARYESAETA